MEEVVRYLRALVFLQVNAQSGEAPGKPEVLLHKAGFKNKEIAEILGKGEAAVAKSISRAKASGIQEAPNE